MEKIAIIGAGISGLCAAHCLKDRYDVTVYEKEDCPGGLIKCQRINGSLFHTCGGHVFNSKRQDVLDWFWEKFVRENEFSKAERNACVFLDSPIEQVVPYPIENHMYYFDEIIQKQFYADLDEIDQVKGCNAKISDYANFGEFLRWRFGKTLYQLYFEPYNKKVWRRDLSSVPMDWMEGKLPMPTTQEIRDNNENKVKEKAFVHSSFWYEKTNGSQYIANRLAESLNIKYGYDIDSLQYCPAKGTWTVLGEEFDKVIFCGNIKAMIRSIKGVELAQFAKDVDALQYHGTTAVFCEIDKNPYSWIYQPSSNHESHRIICTGNFAESNNGTSVPENRITATIEFTDEVSLEQIFDNLEKIPYHPKYLAHKYNQYTYPIQDANTRSLVLQIKQTLKPKNFFFTGRFADWEYYNMDVAMGAAIDLCKQIK